MSLVNSLVNQIGREIGKDVYKSAKKSFINYTTNSFSSKVLSFKPSAYDKVTIRNLTQLVEDSYLQVGYDNYNLHTIFSQLDDIIDSLKDSVDEKWKNELEELDIKNENNYKQLFSLHKKWIEEQITEYEIKVNSYIKPDYFSKHLSNIWAYIWVVVNIFALNKIISNNDVENKSSMLLMCVIVFGIPLLVSIWLRNSKIKDIEREHEKNENSLYLLKNYFNKINLLKSA